MTTLETVTQEIEYLHDFFTGWFSGTIGRDQLQPRFLSRLHDDVQVITPECQVMTRAILEDGFTKGYGANPNFRIQIRDVNIRLEQGDIVVATYTEWQKGAANSASPNNGRLSTVVMKMTAPPTWLHVHETWLPKEVQAAGPYDF